MIFAGWVVKVVKTLGCCFQLSAAISGRVTSRFSQLAVSGCNDWARWLSCLCMCLLLLPAGKFYNDSARVLHLPAANADVVEQDEEDK
jgi:hypothetical protein